MPTKKLKTQFFFLFRTDAHKQELIQVDPKKKKKGKSIPSGLQTDDIWPMANSVS